ncbi:MAG TPA: hypothetical protein VHG32_13445 [Thermoanaerobaculia bacterium]|jgi:hypothetical protein|nr:hypothetical protein [Thermoanaerobaculia bacterium]
MRARLVTVLGRWPESTPVAWPPGRLDVDGSGAPGEVTAGSPTSPLRCMVAFWDGKSTGTQDAFTRAIRLGRYVVVYRLRLIALVGTLILPPSGPACY